MVKEKLITQDEALMRVEPEQLDHTSRVVGSGHPDADPSRVGQDVMRLRAAGCDELVVQFARQGNIGQPVAVDVAHLFAPEAIFDAAESVRQRLHPRPGGDLFPDELSRVLHM